MLPDKKLLNFQGKNGRDEFKREQIADKAISLLTSEIEVSPMVIDGDWGTGKTEFCHKLINKFKANHTEYSIVYVDAFQADHADNPLMTILAEVMSLLPEGSKKEGFLKRAIPVARYGITTALKAGASHLLRANADDLAAGLDKHLEDAANTVIDASVLAVLREHEKAKENLEALQIALSELAEEKPIVIFIDELDRCRPDFAVQMLEVIKHTFDVKGVQFVLVTNTTQLRAAINHRYGPLVDAQRYLDKFLNFSFSLPDGILGTTFYDHTRLGSAEHFNNLIKESTVLINTDLSDYSDGLGSFANTLIIHNKLSLREVETFVRHLEIFTMLSQSFDPRYSNGTQLLQVFGVYIFCFRHDIEDSIRTNKTDANTIVKLLSANSASELEAGLGSHLHSNIIAFFLASDCFYNKDNYQPKVENAEKWTQEFSSYFGYRTPVQGERFTLVLQAINSLSLN